MLSCFLNSHSYSIQVYLFASPSIHPNLGYHATALHVLSISSPCLTYAFRCKNARGQSSVCHTISVSCSFVVHSPVCHVNFPLHARTWSTLLFAIRFPLHALTWSTLLFTMIPTLFPFQPDPIKHHLIPHSVRACVSLQSCVSGFQFPAHLLFIFHQFPYPKFLLNAVLLMYNDFFHVYSYIFAHWP